MIKRPLLIITVGYITGILWGLYLRLSIVPIFFLFWGIYFILKNRQRKISAILKSKKFKLNIIIFIVFSTISNIQILYLENKHENLYKELEKVKIIGTVISQREETSYQFKYTLKVEEVNGSIEFKGTNLLLYTQKDVVLDYGDKINIVGEYEEAKKATNYKLFDYREYLKEKNVYGIVKAEEVKIIEKDNINSIFIFFNDIREKTKDNLKEIVGENSSIVIGILLRRCKRYSR